MEDKEAIEVLKRLLEKYPLDESEKEAIREAIGILGWSKLSEGWMQRMKKARDKRVSEE